MKALQVLKRLSPVLIASACLCALEVPSSAATKVQVAYAPVGGYLAAYVAKDQGIFEKHGLDVSFVPIKNAAEAISAVVSESTQFGGVGPVDIIRGAQQGLNLKAIAGGEVLPTGLQTMVVVKDGGQVTKPEDLAGRKMTVNVLDGILHIAARHWLQTRGVDYRKVSFIEVGLPQAPSVLQSGQVDAIVSTSPYTERMLAQGGFRSLGRLYDGLPDGTLLSVYFVGEWGLSHPKEVEAFRVSIKEANTYIQSHPDEVKKSFARYTKLPDADIARVGMPGLSTDVSPSNLTWLMQTMLDQKALDAPIDLKKVVWAKNP